MTIANLGELSRAAARAPRALPARTGGLPLYLTEFGYQTNPPDPLGVSSAHQAAYLNESEYIA